MRRMALFLPLLLSGCLLDKDKLEVSMADNQCYEILQSNDGQRPLMINKCTGESWMLVRTFLENASGKPTGSFAYRWSPLTISNTGEAEFDNHYRGPPQ